MKKIAKFMMFGFIGFVALIVVIAVATSGGDTTEPVSEAVVEKESDSVEVDVEVVEVAEEEVEPVVEEEAIEVVEEEVVEEKFSVAQKNAIRQAEQYLDYTAFSKSGLIKQLEFEGYSNEDAAIAVENIVVDWQEQAVKSAEQYMDYSSFSRSGLIQQLTFEGHSQADAEHGATQVGL